MTVTADALTGGFIVGSIAAIIIALACIGAIWLGARGLRRWARTERGLATGLLAGGLACLLVTLGVWLWASWPLAYDYHHWVDKSVQITAVSKRLVPAGDKAMEEKFVVRGADGEAYGILDTRAALIKPGEAVRLRCKKAYQFGVSREAHGWDCRWAGPARSSWGRSSWGKQNRFARSSWGRGT